MNIGTQLRQARESHGLSLAQLAATTRVNARLLESLERNDLTAIPRGPYARGFIASYAREVGLNSEETVRNYFAQFEQAGPPTAPPRRPAPSAVPLEEDDRWRPLPVVAWVLLIVLIGAFAAGQLRNPPAPPGAVAVGTTGVVPAGDPTLAAAQAAQLEPKPVASSPSAAPARPAEARAATTAAANGEELVVALQAERPSWLSARVDGERKVYQMLQPGMTQMLRGSREIVLRVGDAGALRWSVNGREATLMGRSGEVRTIKLTPDDAR